MDDNTGTESEFVRRLTEQIEKMWEESKQEFRENLDEARRMQDKAMEEAGISKCANCPVMGNGCCIADETSFNPEAPQKDT